MRYQGAFTDTTGPDGNRYPTHKSQGGIALIRPRASGLPRLPRLQQVQSEVAAAAP